MSEEAKKEPKKSSLLVIILMVLNCAAIGGGLTLAYMGSFPGDKKTVKEDILMQEWEDAQKAETNDRHYYTLNPFKARLKGMPRNFVNISMDLELLNEQGFEEISDLGAEARDTILKILDTKTATELRSVQGKLLLKQEIITQLNGFLEKGIVKNAYFSSFAIQ